MSGTSVVVIDGIVVIDIADVLVGTVSIVDGLFVGGVGRVSKVVGSVKKVWQTYFDFGIFG